MPAPDRRRSGPTRPPVRSIRRRRGVAVAVALVAAGATAACGSNGSGSDGGSDTAATSSTTTTVPVVRGDVLLEETFDRPDGVVSDERVWHDPGATPDDAVWAATSGVFRVADGEGWSDSPVFRVVTQRRDLGDVAVSFRLRVDGPTDGPDRPEEAWDGVHVLLHYQDETELYAVSVSRRDGEVAIKRKDPGGPSNGGSYSTLAHGPGAVTAGRWTDVAVTIHQQGDGVDLAVTLDGTTVLTARDTDAVGDRVSRPGRVGFRADNTTFRIDDVRVQELRSPNG